MARTTIEETVGICVVCNRNVKKDKLASRQIDGLWVCSSGCIDKFLKEKKKWIPENWEQLCRMQALYEERKRTECQNVPC